MGSFQHPRAFHPLDLEIMDHVYEAAWAQLKARDPFRDTEHDGERQKVLRQYIMELVGTDRIEFDTLCEKVLANMPETWMTFGAPNS